MAEILVVKPTEKLSTKVFSLNFQNSYNHKIITNIDEFFTVIKSGIICSSFLEGWSEEHLKYVGLMHEQLKSQPNLCSLVATSATTGKPKLCVYSAPTLEKILNVSYSEDFFGCRIYSSLSLSHSYMYPGTVLPALRTSELLVLDRTGNPLSFLKIIKRYHIDFVVSVPAQLKIWSKFKVKLNSVKKVYSAGGPFPYESLTDLEGIFPNAQFVNNYGATECGPRIGQMVINHTKLKNCFTPIDQGTIEIKKNKAVYKSPRLMYNYLGEQGKINLFNLSDAIRLDGKNFLVLGRTDNVLNLGGKKVSYEHVKKLVKEMPGISSFFFDEKAGQVIIVINSKERADKQIAELSQKLLVERSYIQHSIHSMPKVFK